MDTTPVQFALVDVEYNRVECTGRVDSFPMIEIGFVLRLIGESERANRRKMDSGRGRGIRMSE